MFFLNPDMEGFVRIDEHAAFVPNVGFEYCNGDFFAFVPPRFFGYYDCEEVKQDADA